MPNVVEEIPTIVLLISSGFLSKLMREMMMKTNAPIAIGNSVIPL